jgi:catechol 2,3-dioxygenase-like lactoylglutathione lyase family enzyme
MSDEFGAPPRHGWAPMVAELHVNKLEDSLQFWCELLGFEVAYRRPAEKFVYLERPEGAQIMLCQRHGRFETGPLERPLGQGVTCNPTFMGDSSTKRAKRVGISASSQADTTRC